MSIYLSIDPYSFIYARELANKRAGIRKNLKKLCTFLGQYYLIGFDVNIMLFLLQTSHCLDARTLSNFFQPYPVS